MNSIYWINQTLAALPATLWIFFGVGLPWALVVLPRKDWRSPGLVACVTLAFGPMLLSAWMFVLGTIGGAQESATLNMTAILAGTATIAVSGSILAWRKAHRGVSSPTRRAPLTMDEKLIIAMITVAVFIRWFTMAYWPFTSYDPLWVYGYEGRLYTLLGYIPQNISYYPQFLPLQYTYGQLAVGGAVGDHAARVVLPFLHVGSIIAAYVLGARLFKRRTGVIAAGLWALYPHVAQWAHVGDLEIPVTFLFTGSAAFFLMAWTEADKSLRQRYALIAGLFLGGALWTKPTAGALVWGMMLATLAEFVRARGDWRAAYPRFETAIITALAAMPLGGVWYIRNVLLGYNAIDLPHSYWLTQAQRSGREFGWPLMVLITLLVYLYVRRKNRPNIIGGATGLVMILAGMLPSILDPARVNSPESRINLLELALLAGGMLVLAVTLWSYARGRWTTRRREYAAKIGWTTLLALPYFATWFYSYSYHYRLSFPIVPLMLIPTAVVLSEWFRPERISNWRGAKRIGYAAVVIAISLPGIVSTLYRHGRGWDWLWSDVMPDDMARYAEQNPSLMFVVRELNAYIELHGEQPVVSAPGAQLLPFFFPLAEIDIESTPRRYADLEGVMHYVYSKHASLKYREDDFEPREIQIVAGLGREDIMPLLADHDDGNWWYEIYELNLDSRFTVPEDVFINEVPDNEVVIGDFARYAGANVHWAVFNNRQKLLFEFYWEVLTPPPEDSDFMIYLDLLNEDDDTVYAAWEGPVAPSSHGYYSTRLWEPGEYVIDRRFLRLEDPESVPGGDNYRIVIGMYNPETGERLPVTENGESVGDGLPLETVFAVTR